MNSKWCSPENCGFDFSCCTHISINSANRFHQRPRAAQFQWNPHDHAIVVVVVVFVEDNEHENEEQKYNVEDLV